MADIDVRCRGCDSLLDAEFRQWGKSSTVLVVEPCKKCMDDASTSGYDKAKEDSDWKKEDA